MRPFFRRYSSWCYQRPYQTAFFNSGLTYALGDYLVNQDASSAVRFGIFGAFQSGLVTTNFYRSLRLIRKGSPSWIAFKKMLWENGFYIPFIYSPCFFFSTSLLKGESLYQGWTLLKREEISAVTTAWKVWVPASFLNFYWVPPHLNVTFKNGVALLWCMVLSWWYHDLEEKNLDESSKKDATQR